MKVKLLSGALGAEISGVDLSKNLDNGSSKEIYNLFLEHKVIAFRDQNLSQEQHFSIAKIFGSPEKHVYVKGTDLHPEIIRLDKEPQETINWGQGWHSDVSYAVQPNKAVILYSRNIPPVGGDTLFANMELAWNTLSEDIKNRVKDLKAIHSSHGAGFFTTPYKTMKSNGNTDSYSNPHRVVRTHPETGKKILFVNRTYTVGFVDMDKQESDHLLEEIYAHQESPELSCRFKWTDNTLVALDNRSVIHYAIADYFPERSLGYRRVMDRIAITGDTTF